MVRDQNNQAELHDDREKRSQSARVLSKRASSRRRRFADRDPYFTVEVRSLSLSHYVELVREMVVSKGNDSGKLYIGGITA